jgi:CRP-like cAMP-binding protein
MEKLEPKVNERYLDKINSFIEQLDKEALTTLETISTRKTFKKGEFLLRQDEVCRFSYVIEKGIARKYYLSDGKEITTELFFDSDIAVSLVSYTIQNPSKEFIQAITETTVLETDYNAFQQAKRKHRSLMELDLMMIEYYAIWLEERLFEFHTLSATQRYSLLLKEHPYIIKAIPLTHIASYLGISLETLSRIRASI